MLRKAKNVLLLLVSGLGLALATWIPAANAEKPVWHFTLLVSIDTVFVERLGGLDVCDSLIRNQLDSVNDIYNDPGVFNGRFDFSLGRLRTFSGSGLSQVHQVHPNQDYHLIYDFDSRFLFSWSYPPDNCVLFSTFSTEEAPFPFITPGTLVLAHELAHSRGAVDQYGLDVDSAWNFVNGESFEITGSYMSEVMSQVWSEHTIAVINRNAGEVLSVDQFQLRTFPGDMIVRAVDADGYPLIGAEVNIYGHGWYDMRLDDRVIRSGETNSRGEFGIDSRDFTGIVPGESCVNALCLKYSTLLVEVVGGEDTGYVWLPFLEPQTHALRNRPGPFVKTVELGHAAGAQEPLPDWLRLSQNYPNPFNGQTNICFSLLVPGQVRLEVNDILGRTLAVLHDGGLPPGPHCFDWDSRAPSGVYFARIIHAGHSRAVKMLLIR